jgi:broad specificity phosphatase PhoE
MVLLSGLFFYCNKSQNIESETELRLIVVRHAEAYTNLEGTGSMPPEERDSLTPRGKEQAKARGQVLKDYPVACWISSPAGRAMETRDVLVHLHGEKEKVKADSAFASIRDGWLPDGAKVPWAWRLARWEAGEDHRPAGGESLADVVERILDRVESLKREYKRGAIVIVTHSDICAVIKGHALGTPLTQRITEHRMGLAEAFEIRIMDDGAWKMIEVM